MKALYILMAAEKLITTLRWADYEESSWLILIASDSDFIAEQALTEKTLSF